ncbi:MAG: AAA family ATPase [Planctomycetes bacterium]|nr:AAA family ATPase [Planctomycetota bacterium]
MNDLKLELPFKKESFFSEIKKIVRKESLYSTWFSRAEVELNQEGEIVLLVPHEFAANFIRKKFLGPIQEMSLGCWGKNVLVDIKVVKITQNNKKEIEVNQDNSLAFEKRALLLEKQQPRFNDFSFKDFVSGHENQFAYVAAKALTSHELDNSPLTVIGEHGTGKTHLAMAIVDGWKMNEVAHLHAEEFLNSYVRATQEGQLSSFRASIRSKKIFILEDLDFLLEGKKTKTVNELLNTFKVLKREKRHIVITSRNPILDYELVSPKLSSFLLSGLKVRLTAPSEATRKKLIEQSMAKQAWKISGKCRSFIEDIEFKSCGDLLGAMKQLQAYSSLEKGNVCVSTVREILSDHLRSVSYGGASDGSVNDLHAIANAVSKAFGVSFQKLVSKSRERHISLARHTAMALSYDQHYTLREIGQFYGGRLHQTVLSAIQKVTQKKEKELDFQRCYDKLFHELNESS